MLGGVTPLAQAAPPHPEPRVIVNVLSVEGPHPQADVQRSLRLGWNRIVRCYKAHGGRSKGKLELNVHLSSQGKVKAARATGSTWNDSELTSCLVAAVRQLSVPRAAADSQAIAEIKLAPGDPPERD